MNEDESGPNMDKINYVRGPSSNTSVTSSNNADKATKEAGRSRNNGFNRRGPRGSGFHDSASGSLLVSTSSDPRRHKKGHNKQQQRQEQPRPGNALQEHHGGAAMTQEDEFEVGSVFNPGSKKQNLNHLLNFQFEPKGHKNKKLGGPASSGGGHLRQRNNSYKRPKYNKEQYLQANCQFVVKSSGNYNVHLADPDTLVDWDLIEQVVLKTTAAVPSCPICLYPPKAAKITRCGHVFCWPCILHYLALSDHSWRKCPICYEAIHRQDLKSVVSVPWREFQVNDEIELCLMRRERSSLFALPVGNYFPEVNEKHPNVQDKLTSYSQLVLASPGQVARNIIEQERFELEDQYRTDKDEPESCFIEEALQYLSQRKNGIEMTTAEVANDLVEEEEEISDEFEGTARSRSSLEDFNEEDERPRHTSSSSDGTAGSLEDGIDFVTADDLDISTIQPANETKKKLMAPKDTFYFYQSSDGQPIYLHALNVQMLVDEHGGLEHCPKVIRGKIVEKDNTSMTEELRNRLRYLRHMPITSIFEVCEIILKPPMISKESLVHFGADLEARRRKRNKRAREEKRREKWIMAEEDKRNGKFPDLKCRIESAFHFPQVGLGMAIPSSTTRSTESLVSIDSTLSTPPPGAYGNDNQFSFSKILREGAARPSTMMMVPKSQTFPSLSLKSPNNNEDSEPEPEDYVPPPPKTNLGDALAHAFAQATTINPAAATTTTISGNSAGKKKSKKMKGQKISLTSSARPRMD